MRISDWSSDVCSSDLLLEELRKGKAGVADGKALICSLQGVRPPRDWKDEEDAKGTTAKLARFLHSEAENKAPIDMEIGRATCRERGGQYGEIPVVAVYLKKKTHKQTISRT